MLNVLSYKLSYYYNYQLSSVLDTGCIDLKILIFCTLSVIKVFWHKSFNLTFGVVGFLLQAVETACLRI